MIFFLIYLLLSKLLLLISSSSFSLLNGVFLISLFSLYVRLNNLRRGIFNCLFDKEIVETLFFLLRIKFPYLSYIEMVSFFYTCLDAGRRDGALHLSFCLLPQTPPDEPRPEIAHFQVAYCQHHQYRRQPEELFVVIGFHTPSSFSFFGTRSLIYAQRSMCQSSQSAAMPPAAAASMSPSA